MLGGKRIRIFILVFVGILTVYGIVFAADSTVLKCSGGIKVGENCATGKEISLDTGAGVETVTCIPGTDHKIWVRKADNKKLVQRVPKVKSDGVTPDAALVSICTKTDNNGRFINQALKECHCRAFYCAAVKVKDIGYDTASNVETKTKFDPLSKDTDCAEWILMPEEANTTIPPGAPFSPTATIQKTLKDVYSEQNKIDEMMKIIDAKKNGEAIPCDSDAVKSMGFGKMCKDAGGNSDFKDALKDAKRDNQDIIREFAGFEGNSGVDEKTGKACDPLANPQTCKRITQNDDLKNKKTITSPGDQGQGSNDGNIFNGHGSSPSTFAQGLQALNQALNGAAQCTITASPSRVQIRQGQQPQPVQLQWYATPTNMQDPPYMVQISQVGNMPPTGSASVYPQQTTTYSGSVVTQRGQYGQCTPATVTVTQTNQNGGTGYGTDGQPCPAAPAQPTASSCSAGTWKTVPASNGCTVGWRCVNNDGTTGQVPTAELRCEPALADVGMSLGIAWSCGGTATGSLGGGFSTGGGLSGSITTTIAQPPAGTTMATYGLACTDGAATTSASCSVRITQSNIVFVGNPATVRAGEHANLGWVTPAGAMQKCTPSSPDLSGWTAEHVNDTAVNGAIPTPPLSATTRFIMTCTTTAGGIKTAETRITVQ